MSVIERRALVGRNIKLARKQAGHSQERFARLVEVRPHHLSDWETGKIEPNPRSLQRIADALELPFGWFYTGHDGDGSSDGV